MALMSSADALPVCLTYRHAGVLFGITNTAATIPGMIAPLVVGALTPNVSRTHHYHRRQCPHCR